MSVHLFFWIGFVLILVHEMDAVRYHEWAMFPLLSRLDDSTGYTVFTAAHVLLYGFLIWLLLRGNEPNLGLVRALDIFFVVHVFLHVLFLRHPKNQFTGWFSWAIIVGCGIAGGLDLVLA